MHGYGQTDQARSLYRVLPSGQFIYILFSFERVQTPGGGYTSLLFERRVQVDLGAIAKELTRSRI